MENIQTTSTSKKAYHTPELKDLGKIGEITNTNSNGSTPNDGGTGAPTYNS